MRIYSYMPKNYIHLNPNNKKAFDLLIIAGEASGDEHAALLVKQLKQAHPELTIAALGGARLKAADVEMLYPLANHSVVGFIEVLRHYPFFKKFFEELVDWIAVYQPKNICLVDYPGFNLRLAARLKAEGISRKGGGKVNIFYYIAPQIWAWKSHRRFTMADQLDALSVIFPFEVDCFKDTGLPTTFVRHPFMEAAFLPAVTYDAQAPLLLLPGSRRAAVMRIFPIMVSAFDLFSQKYPDIKAVVIYPNDSIKAIMENILRSRPHLEDKVTLKPSSHSIKGCAVLTSSGTMSLNCALAGIPGVIVYRAHPLTYFWAKRLVKITHIGIANILLNEPVYPEFIQQKAKADGLAKQIETLLFQQDKVEAAQHAAERLRSLLSAHKTTSAAQWLINLMGH